MAASRGGTAASAWEDPDKVVGRPEGVGSEDSIGGALQPSPNEFYYDAT